MWRYGGMKCLMCVDNHMEIKKLAGIIDPTSRKDLLWWVMNCSKREQNGHFVFEVFFLMNPKSLKNLGNLSESTYSAQRWEMIECMMCIVWTVQLENDMGRKLAITKKGSKESSAILCSLEHFIFITFQDDDTIIISISQTCKITYWI